MIERRFQAPITNRIRRKAAEATSPMASAGATVARAISAAMAPPTAATMTVRMAGRVCGI